MMKKITSLICLYLLLSSNLVFAGVNSAAAYGPSNRILAGGNPPEPRCAVSRQESNRVFADDRANKGVVVFDDCDFSPVDKVPQAPGKPTCSLCGPK